VPNSHLQPLDAKPQYNHKRYVLELLFEGAMSVGSSACHGPCPGRSAARRLSGVVRC
jgi:hypothetical protein